MDWNLFIVPLMLIVVELIKKLKLDSIWLPFIAVTVGGLLGVLFGVYYKVDLLEHIVSGVIYGAAAAGVSDLGKSGIVKLKGD